ncbi:MAG: hypothetical protein ACI4O7_08910, partial [Aristaeellaceae bacterium]
PAFLQVLLNGVPDKVAARRFFHEKQILPLSSLCRARRKLRARALHHYTFIPLKIQGARWYFSRSAGGAMCIFAPSSLQNAREFRRSRQAGSIRPKNDIYNEGKCFSFNAESGIIDTFGTVNFRRFPRAGNGPVRPPDETSDG